MDREDWHKGYEIVGATMNCGHSFCAGCGKLLGMACLALTGEEWPPEPRWPFNEETCPVCYLRDKLMEHERGPVDKLTQRMLAMQAAKGK